MWYGSDLIGRGHFFCQAKERSREQVGIGAGNNDRGSGDMAE